MNTTNIPYKSPLFIYGIIVFILLIAGFSSSISEPYEQPDKHNSLNTSGSEIIEPANDFVIKKRNIGGQEYRSLRHNHLIWMAENLNLDLGINICYEENKSNCRKYGRLYERYSAENACASIGGRLATNGEWYDLIKAFEGDMPINDKTAPQGFHKNRAYGTLIEGGSSGFNVLLGSYGALFSSGSISFGDIGDEASYWTSTFHENYPSQPLYYSFERVDAKVERFRTGERNYHFLHSCRCVVETEEYKKLKTGGYRPKTFKIHEGQHFWAAEWTLENLNYPVEGGYIYENKKMLEPRAGLLYTYDAAKNICSKLGDGWRLPNEDDFFNLVAPINIHKRFNRDYLDYYDKLYDEESLFYEYYRDDFISEKLFKYLMPGGDSQFELIMIGMGDVFSGSQPRFYGEGKNVEFWGKNIAGKPLSFSFDYNKKELSIMSGIIDYDGEDPKFLSFCRCVKGGEQKRITTHGILENDPRNIFEKAIDKASVVFTP